MNKSLGKRNINEDIPFIIVRYPKYMIIEYIILLIIVSIALVACAMTGQMSLSDIWLASILPLMLFYALINIITYKIDIKEDSIVIHKLLKIRQFYSEDIDKIEVKTISSDEFNERVLDIYINNNHRICRVKECMIGYADLHFWLRHKGKKIEHLS